MGHLKHPSQTSYKGLDPLIHFHIISNRRNNITEMIYVHLNANTYKHREIFYIKTLSLNKCDCGTVARIKNASFSLTCENDGR